jgi:hypothetical protein
MIWFWSREKQKMQLETRYDNATKEYVITIRRHDDQQQTERFADIVAFRRRLVALEKQLEDDRWIQSGTPTIDPEGFPNRRPSDMN